MMSAVFKVIDNGGIITVIIITNILEVWLIRWGKNTSSEEVCSLSIFIYDYDIGLNSLEIPAVLY